MKKNNISEKSLSINKLNFFITESQKKSNLKPKFRLNTSKLSNYNTINH